MVYKERVADLYRLATLGTGVLPDGDIHPDLAARLAGEAQETASHILQMCIRAIDYCPPVDITFGDYFRAIITADEDVNPDDKHNYRVALIESFREWGIYPFGIRSMSEDSLLWPTFDEAWATSNAESSLPGHKISVQVGMVESQGRGAREKASESLSTFIDSSDEISQADFAATSQRAWSRPTSRRRWDKLDVRQDRHKLWQDMETNAQLINLWLTRDDESDVASTLGLILHDADAKRTVYRNDKGKPTIEVHSVRPIVLRTDDYGAQDFLVVEVLQRRRGYLRLERQQEVDEAEGPQLDRSEEGDFTYRSGCTFFINPQSREIRWVIRTAGTINDDQELARLRRYLNGDDLPGRNEFAALTPRAMGLASTSTRSEPFAILHDHEGRS